MKIRTPRILAAAIPALLSLCVSSSAFALEGQPLIHDPSTVMQCDGKWYTFGTGGGGIMSDDGWTWRSGAVRPNGGAAPDAIKIGDRYLIAYGASGGGLGGGHNAKIYTMWTKSLDPQSPDLQFSQGVEVASSDGIEDCDAIDPAFCLDGDGRLWLTYGTFFGFIRVVELDPKTGKRVEGNQPVNIAIDCEGTDLIYQNGYYYLFGTHGTCCNGATSTYHIRVGRSKKVTGPYLDHTGQDMLKGGGKLVVAANGRYIGPGHFGLIDLGDDVQKYSCHYEADLDRGGASILEIRSLLWKDGWPVTGENFVGGTFEIESARSGNALELGVEAVPLGGGRGGRGGMGGMPGRGGRGAPPAAPAGGPGAMAPDQDRLVFTAAPAGPGGPGAGGPPAGGARGGARGGGGMGMGRGMFGGTGQPIPPQDVAVVSKTWPDTQLGLRLGYYMTHAHQKWTITPVKDAPGFIGTPSFKITVAGTDRALASADNGEVIVVPSFTGKPEELWRIDQLTDGTWRIMPKSIPNTKEPMALTAVGLSTPSLSKFDAKSVNGRWIFKAP
jgi:arabinan endo-1,5-alpha-L-arabinosidase